MGRDLAHSSHQGGRQRGRHIFRTLLHVIRPPTLIAHGKGTIRDLESVLGVHLPKLPTDGAKVIRTQADGMSVYVPPSLAPPAFNKWSKWAENYMDKVASAVAADLAI